VATAESRPQSFAGLIADPRKPGIIFTAPTKAGAYRLFGYVFDGMVAQLREHSVLRRGFVPRFRKKPGEVTDLFAKRQMESMYPRRIVAVGKS